METLLRLLLGERMDVPPHLPPDSVPPGVILRVGRLIPGIGGFFARMRGPAAAVTLRKTIIVHPAVRLTPELLAHELVHVRQWLEVPLFPLRYVLATFRSGYRENPFEIEARSGVSKPRENEPARSNVDVMETSVITIGRHIMDAERRFPEATGALSTILYELALAAKMITREVRRAGLVDIIGQTGQVNVHGDQVRKLDEYADDVIFKALDHCGHLCVMASEESEGILPIPDHLPTGGYVLLYDPLDGSSNIDANISVGTIFSIHRKISSTPRGTLEDCLQAGYKQVAAGYVLYGSSTMLVYTTGNGVHGFTLDPSIGEFILSHPWMKIPSPGQRIYSTNEGRYSYWTPQQRALVDYLKGVDPSNPKPFTSRYVGSMVADVHRTLLYGGLFMYPGDAKNPEGKLRLVYEAAPMAMIIQGAGGRATDGTRNLLDIDPTDIHQKTPVFLGSPECMDLVDQYLNAPEEELKVAAEAR